MRVAVAELGALPRPEIFSISHSSKFSIVTDFGGLESG
jgi:hypothetical protein